MEQTIGNERNRRVRFAEDEDSVSKKKLRLEETDSDNDDESEERGSDYVKSNAESEFKRHILHNEGGNDYSDDGSNSDEGDKYTDKIEKGELFSGRNYIEEDISSNTDSVQYSKKIEGEEQFSGHDYTEDGIKIIPFNMEEELEEGTIDDSGNYVAYNDQFSVHDRWLEGITKKDTENAKAAVERVNKENELKMSTTTPLKSTNQVLLEILQILKPRESLAKAMRRLSPKHNTNGVKWVPKWKAKSLERKKSINDIKVENRTQNCTDTIKRAPEDCTDAMKEAAELNVLVTCTSHLTDIGEYEALDLTYEQIVRKLRLAEVLPDTWMPMDPLPDIR